MSQSTKHPVDSTLCRACQHIGRHAPKCPEATRSSYYSKFATACEMSELDPLISPVEPGHEYMSVARSQWIEGVHIDERLQDDATVAVRRIHGNYSGENYIEHAIELDLGRAKVPLEFSVEGAQQLGAALLRAAAMVMLDRAENVDFLAEGNSAS